MSTKETSLTPSMEKIVDRLKKLSTLQGFVTEAQIDELAATPDVREHVETVLTQETATTL